MFVNEDFGFYKKVYWVNYFEEIVYFIFFSFEYEEMEVKFLCLLLKKFRMKVCVLKNK